MTSVLIPLGILLVYIVIHESLLSEIQKIPAFCAMALVMSVYVSTAQGSEIQTVPVIDAQPVYRIYEKRIPYQECWNEQVKHVETSSRGSDSYTGTILGGVIGGAIGHAIGHKKRNKQVGAVVGTILGGSIGRDVSNHYDNDINRRIYYTTERKCVTRHDIQREERIVGYDVTYEYQGNHQIVRMKTKPGDTIQVRVTVTPL